MNDADKDLVISLKVGPCRFAPMECWDIGPICYCKAMDEGAERIKQLSDRADALKEALVRISDLIGAAAQGDCESGVRWLNERASANYLKGFPMTLEALLMSQEIIDKALSDEGDKK